MMTDALTRAALAEDPAGLNLGAAAYPQWRDGALGGMAKDMAEIVNLRLARKARDRASAQVKAAQNRAAHGRTLAERKAAEVEQVRRAQIVEQHRREREED